LSRAAWSTSATHVTSPACALTCAIPEPMSPQPTTPTVFIAIDTLIGVSFQLERDPEPAAHAERGEAEPRVSSFHLVEQGRDDACAGRADGMTERDRAAVHVQPLPIEAEVPVAREHLRRERLVQLDEIVG